MGFIPSVSHILIYWVLMATHSSVLAWRIPRTGEPGGLPSMGSQSRTRLKRRSSSSSCQWCCQYHSLLHFVDNHCAPPLTCLPTKTLPSCLVIETDTAPGSDSPRVTLRKAQAPVSWLWWGQPWGLRQALAPAWEIREGFLQEGTSELRPVRAVSVWKPVCSKENE